MTTNWYSDDHATLGDRLAVAREHSGLSQSALAGKIGIRVKTLRDWENDLSEPRANRLQMLAAMLGVSLRWLLTGQGDDIGPPPDDDDPRPDARTSDTRTLAEIRAVKAELIGLTERLSRLEKSLRPAARGTNGHD